MTYFASARRGAGQTIQNAQVGTEFISPEQHGGIYGTIFRQYFNTSLPSDLTSGSNVSRLIDFTVVADTGVDRFTVSGWSSDGTNTVIIRLTGTSGNGNLILSSSGTFAGNIQFGWVDYTK